MAGWHRQGDMHERYAMPPGDRDVGAAGGTAVPKVPAVNVYFWLVKVLTTAMGEATSDFLVKQFNPYLAVLAGFVVFVIAITWQLRVPTYRSWPYWIAVSMVAVFGTMVADSTHIALGVPYKVSVSLFAVALVVIFVIWYRVEGTLSIHSIVTPRRELFYWATVCCTFALGTATGDFTATTLHLGYFTSGVVFTLVILVPLVAWRLGVNPVLTFWVAYVLTRPIGASFADFFGMPKTSGGLGIGHGRVSLVTVILVVASIAYLARTHKDQPSAQPLPADAGYAPQPGYWPQAGYPASGYPPQPGYAAQAAYPPQPGQGPSFTPAPGQQPDPGQNGDLRGRPAPDEWRGDDGYPGGPPDSRPS
jgi:uncharacterized membrane-anchored protein